MKLLKLFTCTVFILGTTSLRAHWGGCDTYLFDSSNGVGGTIMVTCKSVYHRYDIGHVKNRKLERKLTKKCEKLGGSSLSDKKFNFCKEGSDDKKCGRLKAKCNS